TFDFDGDLNGTDVRVVEKPEQIYSQVTLSGGLPYLGEQRNTFTTRPVTWGNFEDRDINDPGAVKLAMFQGSIVGVDGVAKDKMAVIPETAFDELTKRDVEVLTRHLELHTPGPQMLVEAPCPHCKIEWMFPIRWGYDDFFAISSL